MNKVIKDGEELHDVTVTIVGDVASVVPNKPGKAHTQDDSSGGGTGDPPPPPKPR